MYNHPIPGIEKLEISKGVITSLNQDGTITVYKEDTDETVMCLIIRSSESPLPTLKENDTVLFVTDTNQTGYILGIIERYIRCSRDAASSISTPPQSPSIPQGQEIHIAPEKKPTTARVDGKRIVIEAQDQIVLQCGKGSISIDKQGKIVIRGTNLVSRSRGPNKIKGASVSLN